MKHKQEDNFAIWKTFLKVKLKVSWVQDYIINQKWVLNKNKGNEKKKKIFTVKKHWLPQFFNMDALLIHEYCSLL